MSWSPQEQGLRQVFDVLAKSTGNESQEIQKQTTLRLQEFSRIPDYPCYLTYILCCMNNEADNVRTVAGLVLKNNAKNLGIWAPGVVEYVKATILTAFNLPDALTRSAVSQVIVTMLNVLEPMGWPEALQHLMMSLDAPDIQQQTTAFGILEKSCEDFPKKFDVEIRGTRPLDFMIPKFIAMTESPEPKIREQALSSVAHFVPLNTQAINANIDALIICLFKRASDESANVRQTVCQCLVMLLASRADKLIPEMHNVAEFMLYSTRDKNENVALEACEFWLTFAEEPDLQAHLKPLLPQLAPVLLQCMVYTEDDLMWLGGDAEDATVPDKASDIKPKFYGGNAHTLDREAETPQAAGGQALKYGEEEDDLDDDDFDLDDEDMSTDWNLRKCAAAAIDVLAVRFGNDLLQVILPHLKDKLWSEDWLQKESGILSLGAMAEGCIDALEPHLPALVPFLINCLNDPKPLVRSIVCWTLGRYASWCTQSDSDEHRNLYFVPTMEGLLRMVLDNNKRVQEAGCSAFATLEEEAGRGLEPFLEPILRNLVFAFDKYQQKNLLILYDAVGTLADAVGPGLNNKVLVDILMPPLINRWQRLSDNDEDIIPLLECLSSVTMSTGPAFVSYAEPVFQRALQIVHDSLFSFTKWQQNPESEEPDKTFLIVAIDLLSGLIQGMGALLEPLILQSNPPLLPMLTISLKHPDAAVRQSAYALVGDLAIGIPTLLQPHISELMPELIAQIEAEPRPEFVSASNNAAWSVGEIALHLQDDANFRNWIPNLIERLVPILLNPKSPKSLMENSAVTIGRLALVQPAIVAPHLDIFAQQWCQALWEIKDNEEKDSAFRGFCSMIEINPAGIQNHFIYFCNSAAKWQSPSPDLKNKFIRIFQGFKSLLGAQWDVQMSQMPPSIPERLKLLYGV